MHICVILVLRKKRNSVCVVLPPTEQTELVFGPSPLKIYMFTIIRHTTQVYKISFGKGVWGSLTPWPNFWGTRIPGVNLVLGINWGSIWWIKDFQYDGLQQVNIQCDVAVTMNSFYSPLSGSTQYNKKGKTAVPYRVAGMTTRVLGEGVRIPFYLRACAHDSKCTNFILNPKSILLAGLCD